MDKETCVVCGSPFVEWHHTMYGVSNRKNSEEYGYVIPLCYAHHRGKNGIHFNKELDLYWKRKAQEHFEETYGTREDFIRIFGRNYL